MWIALKPSSMAKHVHFWYLMIDAAHSMEQIKIENIIAEPCFPVYYSLLFILKNINKLFYIS